MSTTAAPPDRAHTERTTPVRDIVLFSVAFGSVAALAALGLEAVGVWDWLYAFAMTRWIGIIALIAIVAAVRAARLPQPGPAVLWSAITPLILTLESIAVDIVLARLH